MSEKNDAVTRTPVRILVRALDGDAAPWDVLPVLAQRSRQRGLAPPAALIGDWFDGTAVLAPSVRIRAVPAGQAFPLGSAGDVGGPVGGGWIGYLGYGLADPRPAVRRLPLAAGGWADHVLRRDNARRWWFEALREPDPALVAELADIVARPATRPPPQWRCSDLDAPDPEDYRKAVRLAKEEIAAGEIYQVNVCTRFEARFAGDPVAVFAAGVARQRPQRAALVTGRWGTVASLSPELFLARRGRSVRTAPIKGTLPRRGPSDAGNAAALRATTKDVAENVMIVDMARNDLGRVCATGSVAVPQLLDVQPHPGVWHLVSAVTGQL
ncbi:MAG: chorismate-binding protein, partial [Pseudonocardiaceae bacterium]